MNPLIKDTVETLRRSNDPRDKSQATIIEMLCSQDETLASIKGQTTRTNGRVTKHDADLSAISGRLETLEKPALELATLWKSGKGIVAILTAIIGLVAGAFGLVSGYREKPDADTIRAEVKAALEAKKETAPKP